MLVNVIEAHDVSFTYPGANGTALRNLDLIVKAGEWLAVIGQNGSGKSTLVQLLSGLQLPSTGLINIGNTEVNDRNLASIHQQVGIVFQNPGSQFVGSTVAEDVAFGLENRQVPSDEMPAIIKRCLQVVDMWEYRHTSPATLSGGQQQRVAIASVLALQPKILILDEATSMLDPLARQQIMNLLVNLQQQGLTIIMVTHHLSEAEQADRALALNNGEVLAEGPVHAVLSQQKLVRQLELHLAPGEHLLNQLQQLGISTPDRYLTTEEAVQWLKQRLNLTQ